MGGILGSRILELRAVFALPRGEPGDSPLPSSGCNGRREKASAASGTGSGISYSSHRPCKETGRTVCVNQGNAVSIKTATAKHPETHCGVGTASPRASLARDGSSAAGTRDTSSSSAPVPVVEVPGSHPRQSGRKGAVDGRDDDAGVLGEVQAAAGVLQAGLRADSEGGHEAAVIEGAQEGGVLCFLGLGFRVLRLAQLCLSAPWVEAEILFGKRSIALLLQSCLKSPLEWGKMSNASTCAILEASDGGGIGVRRKCAQCHLKATLTERETCHFGEGAFNPVKEQHISMFWGFRVTSASPPTLPPALLPPVFASNGTAREFTGTGPAKQPLADGSSQALF